MPARLISAQQISSSVPIGIGCNVSSKIPIMPDTEKTDDELLAAIEILSSPAYRGLSKFHRETLAEYEREARRRGLKIP